MEGVSRHLKKLKLEVKKTKSAAVAAKGPDYPSRPYAKPRSRQYLRTASSTVGRSPKSSFWA